MPESAGTGADDVARKEFATSFRGFDQHEVRVFLGHVAAELDAVRERERSLEERLAVSTAAGAPRVLGEQELESALGSEMGRVLQAAREAATEMRSRAEEQVGRLLREASDDSTRMRGEAATVLAERTAEAERAASAIRAEAERDIAALRAAAAASAAEAIDVAKERGRQMVGEAQLVRERILRDLGRRRRLGQQHLEQLRAGRERLLEAYRGVQGALDAAMAELVVSEPEARAAAETAGLRAGSEPELTLEELEAEVAAAVDAGLVVVPPRPLQGTGQDPPATGSPPPGDGAGGVVAEGGPAEAEPGAAPASDGGAVPQAVAVVEQAEAAAPERLASVAAAIAPADHDARSQSLRRRMRKAPPPAVRAIDLGHQSEGVRLLPPEPVPVEEDEPVPAPSSAVVDQDEVAGSPEDDEPTEPDLAPPDAAALDEEDDVGPRADDLFARMRAERAATVARANEVLADDGATSRPPGGTAPACDEAGSAPTGAVGETARAAAVAPSSPPRSDDPEADVPAATGTGRGVAPRAAPIGNAGAPAALPGSGTRTAASGRTADAGAGPGTGGARARASDAAAGPAAAPARAASEGLPASPTDGAAAGGAPVAHGETGNAPAPSSEDAGADPTSLFEQRDGVLEAHERSLARALKRVLADEQNSLLDELRRAKGVPGIDVLLPPAPEHAGRYAKAALVAVGAAAMDGAGKALPAGRVRALASELASELVGGLRPRLSRAVDDGGGDEGAATEALSAAYREWRTSRIEPLARHHVLSAWAAGSFAAATKTELQWVIDPEVGCSPDCADNVLAGPTRKGEPFPTGQLHPPAHAGCRCLVVAPTR